MSARVCVRVRGLTAGQVRVGLKPCALCQSCTGAFFRIDELPAFLIKPSVTSQQNKKPNTQKPSELKGRRANMSGKSVIRTDIMYMCDMPAL